MIKSSGDSQNVAINGQTAATIVHIDDYTGYVSPYFVISKGKFTKHYFEGAGRIVSKLGNGSFAQPLKLTAGGVNYGKLTAEQQKALNNYIKGLGVPPGPPTQQGIYATPEFTGNPYPSEVIKPVEENQEPPEGWPRNPVFNALGDVPGPPVQFGPPVEPTTVESGEGFTGIGMPENDIFYFHPDHLGSTSYITAKNGSISQHVEYIAFGEVLFEEHSSSFSSPYLFNGKELDRETNLSYYGARYLDMKTSLWLSVDPMTERGAEYSPYCYAFNNPLNLTDPDGNWPDLPSWSSIKKSYNEAKKTITKSYNDAKSSVAKSYNDIKKTAIQAKNKAVKSTNQAAQDGQKWVKNNKKELLKLADNMQDTGDKIAYAGYGGAIVGSAFAGVGAAPGLAVAAEGEFIALAGSVLEIGVTAIAGDKDKAISKTESEVAWYIAGKVVSEGLDRIIPGPTPDMSEEAAEIIKNGKDILIKGGDVKLGIAKKIVESKDKETKN